MNRMLLRTLSSAVVVAAPWLIVAGELEPAGPPAPTMKTLDEVEPRIPIRGADLPLTISSPGSYYLTEHVSTAGGGITINSDNVTIDLMGYTLAGGTGRGISAGGDTRHNVVKNGVVRGWSDVAVILGDASRVEHVIAEESLAGIQVDMEGMISNCQSNGNDAFGFRIDDRTLVKESSAFGNEQDGFDGSAASDVTFINCTAADNVRWGFKTSSGGSVVGCSSHRNAQGIVVTHNGFVTGSAAHNNSSWGIQTDDNSLILDNVVAANGSGIRITGGHNRVEGNHASSNMRGIHVQSTDNDIVRNSASNSSIANYDIVIGNDVGPIGTAATSTSPWANIE